MLPLFQFIDHVRLRSCRLVFFAALVGYSSISQGVFNTPGQFAVSPSGAAAYDIPIQVPPGTAGMIPKISLSYNSQSGNGSLGYGWALVGFSQISLCPRTIAQDKVKRGIHFDNKDRFCLDGQRLVVSSGNYGADQSEYRTEVESFSKIIAYGAAGNAPASFKVWTKSGLVLEFGTTTDSRIEAQGKATPRIWGISRITDTLGNYLTVSYDENNANGEAYVSRVDYTGNTKASPELMPYASVRFVYEDRPDVTTDTIAGSVLKISKRIKNIRTYVGDALVKDYVLTYTNNGAYHLSSANQADGSLLTKIQECDGSATPVCLNPTSFGWQPGTNNKAIFGTLSDFAPTNLVQVGDFTGDGMADAIGFSRSGKIFTVSTTRGDFYYTASNGSGFASSVPLLSLYGIGGTRQYQYMNGGKPALGLMKDVFWPKLLMADINRDGMDDLINASSYCVRLSKGNSFAADCNVWGSGPIAAAGDINGDGYADIVYDTATPSGPGQLVIAFSGPSGITSTVNTGIVGGSYRCILSNASGCQGWFYMSPEAFLADFDGDGNADLLINNKIMLSNGNGFAAAQDWGLIPGSHVFSVADINGDGRVDVMYDTTTRSAIGKIFVAFSTGTGFAGAYDTGVTTMGFICLSADGVDECPAANFVYSPPYAAIGDMNGDGRADLLVSNGSYSALYNVSDPDLITTFAQTPGGTTTVSYSRYVYSGLYVATNVSETDGIGGVRKSAYSYAGPQINKFGRGFKGFGTVSIYDLDAGVITAMTYLQFFPFIGMASSSIKQTTSGQLLVSTKSEYAHETLTEGAATTYFPYLAKNIDTARDLDGGYITSTQTDYQYDAFGNVKKVVVTSSDGHVKTTVNEYVNDTGKWILGRLVKSVVTSQTP